MSFPKQSFFALSTLFLICPVSPATVQDSSPEKSMVRVNSTLQDYSFLRPWEKGAPTPRRGLGAVIKGNRVLVTAEMCVN